MEPLGRIRYMNGPMPFDRFDMGTGFIHATGREYYDDFTQSWRTEYEDDWTVDYPVTDPIEEEYEDEEEEDEEW